MRKDVSTTVHVTQSEGSTPVANPTEVTFMISSPDLQHVFFTTGSRLTDSDPGGSGTALYRYTDSADPVNDANLTFLDRRESLFAVGASDDGQRAYYQDNLRMRLWDGGSIRAVTPQGIRNVRVDPRGVVPVQSRVSPNGRFFAFLDGIGQTLSPEQSYDAYLFDAIDDTLVCVSCSGAVDGHDTTLVPSDGTSAGPLGFDMPRPPRFLLDDGRMFFSTDAALAAGDVNGTYDAYEFDPATGGRTLLSTGKGSESAWFADASADGEDVFVTTRQRLTGWDADGHPDLYDVRVGGGFAEPEPESAGCSTFECQDAGGAPPQTRIGSGDLASPGNVRRAGRGRFSLARIGSRQLRVFARTGRLVLRVRVPRAGRVRVRSNHTSGATVRVGGAATKRIAIRLDRSARRRLGQRGRLRVSVVVSFGEERRTASFVLRSAK